MVGQSRRSQAGQSLLTLAGVGDATGLRAAAQALVLVLVLFDRVPRGGRRDARPLTASIALLVNTLRVVA